MNKLYIIAGIVFVVIVGAVWTTRVVNTNTQSAPGDASAGMPVPDTSNITEKVVEEVAAPSAKDVMKPKMYTSAPAMVIDPKKSYAATITTDKGAMKVNLFASETPVTVNNFVFLSREEFYNNTIFHRIIKGFMIQGGDPLGTGAGSPGYKFADEKITRDYTRGTIAMANSGPNTNGSQFFIMHADYALPKNYVIFGAIDPTDAASLAVLNAVAGAPVTDNGMGEASKPVTPTVLQSITVMEE